MDEWSDIEDKYLINFIEIINTFSNFMIVEGQIYGGFDECTRHSVVSGALVGFIPSLRWAAVFMAAGRQRAMREGVCPANRTNQTVRSRLLKIQLPMISIHQADAATHAWNNS